jgi:hypothetical protein
MIELTNITLARALKVKNRLAGRIAKMDNDIKAHNCYQAGIEAPDVRALYEQRKEVVARLIGLKTAISEANVEIQREIYQLAELKAELALVANLNTRHGELIEGFQGTKVNYIAQLHKADVDAEIVRLEAEADRLQDRLEAFNQQTMIQVDVQALAAAGRKE